MCATELFAIHASVLNHIISLQYIQWETKREPKRRFLPKNLPKPTGTIHKNIETVTTLKINN